MGGKAHGGLADFYLSSCVGGKRVGLTWDRARATPSGQVQATASQRRQAQQKGPSPRPFSALLRPHYTSGIWFCHLRKGLLPTGP